MAPKRASTSAATPLPPPNEKHPAAELVRAAVRPGSAHVHPPSYHVWIDAPLLKPVVSVADSEEEDEGGASRSQKRKKSSKPTSRKKASQKTPAEILPTPLGRAHTPRRDGTNSNGLIAVADLHARLLGWYAKVENDRSMPWRKQARLDETDDERNRRAYGVWVSEIMLQQTQVATVIPYWTRWMEAFPTVSDLAKATTDQVNERWQGLGYYSRAARLLKGAQTIVRDFDGKMPETAAELELVDGIGPYSAGAIASIAFAQRAPMVDGNIARVLSRLTALHASPTAKSTTSFLWALADVLVPEPTSISLDNAGGIRRNRSGDWNQALMELGATVCTPRAPRCGKCPFADACLASAESRQHADLTSTFRQASDQVETAMDIEDACTLCTPLDVPRGPGARLDVTTYPPAKERKAPREEDTAVCVIIATVREAGSKHVLLVRRPEKGLLAGLYEFPAADLAPGATCGSLGEWQMAVQPVIVSLLDSQNLDLKRSRLVDSVLQVYSHQRRTYHARVCELDVDELPLPHVSENEGGETTSMWIKYDEVPDQNLGNAMKKVWAEAAKDASTRPTGTTAKKGTTAKQRSLADMFAPK